MRAWKRTTARSAAVAAAALALLACGSADQPAQLAGRPSPGPTMVGNGSTPGPAGATSRAAQTEPSPTPVGSAEFEAGAAMRDVRALAGDIGPRESTTQAYREAAGLVGDRFRDLGYDVREQAFRAPEGVSWGVAVPAGRTVNVIAAPPGLDADAEHLVVGAHLDTVPQGPRRGGQRLRGGRDARGGPAGRTDAGGAATAGGVHRVRRRGAARPW